MLPAKDFAMYLLLELRVQGVKEILAPNRLHGHLTALVERNPELIQRCTGIPPLEHPLFGTFTCIDQALDEGFRGGILDYVLPKGSLVFAISPYVAMELQKSYLEDAAYDPESLGQLAAAFVSICC